MKRLLLILMIIALTVRLLAPGRRELPIGESNPINPILPYWKAVVCVELDGKPDTTINRDEWAYGPGQIRADKLKDFNEATGKHYTLIDCLREPVAREVFMWHCLQYTEIETAVKRWNGSGPRTEEYWKKIKNQLCQN